MNRKTYQMIWPCLIALCGLFFPAYLVAGDIDSGRIVVFHFDHENEDPLAGCGEIELKGGRYIPDGVAGGALSLAAGEYVAIPAGAMLNSGEGSLMMWVRPHWGYYSSDAQGKPASHCFASLTWVDGSYLVLSDGWWELAGSPYTYFVTHNRHKAHTHARVRYVEQEWTHLACTWKKGHFVRLYHNGALIAEGQRFPSRPVKVAGALYLGGDNGTQLEDSRWADSDIDELVVSGRALSTEEIRAELQRQDADWKARIDWLDKLRVRPYHPLRDTTGAVLETRSIFDEGLDWMTPSGAYETIRRVKQAGFNVYIPCVWHGRGTRYPCRLAPAEKRLDFGGADPLERLIAIAHKQGIEVHPWFCVTQRTRMFLTDFYTPAKTPRGAFDVHRKAFRAFIVDLVLDVVRRYDVDGINLDYVRTMGLCKCRYCVDDYLRLFGRDLLADSSLRKPDGRQEEHLQQWQDKAMEAIIKGIATGGRAIKPGLIISVDGHPRPRVLPPDVQGRREIAWADAGYVDLIYDMDYEAVPDFEKHGLVRADLGQPHKVVMLLGNYERQSTGRVIPRDARQLSKLVECTQRLCPGGVGIYLYSMLNDAQVAVLSGGAFAEGARSFRRP